MPRKRVRSGTTWEKEVGYSRAVRVGNRVIVSGTTAAVRPDAVSEPDAGAGRVPATGTTSHDRVRVLGEGDPYEQAKKAMEKIVNALEAVGASAEDVVRTRIFLKDIETWDEVGRAHREVFGDAAPASTVVEVSRLIDERMLVEVEAEAVIGA